MAMATDKKRYWYIHGQAYDLQNFIHQHPGGRDALLMSRGLNCTGLFETYHFKNRPPDAILAKYRVAIDTSSFTEADKKELFEDKFLFEPNGFYADVKNRVRKYFDENHIYPKGSSFYIGVMLLQLISILVGLYYAFFVGNLYIAAIWGLIKGVTAVTTGHSLSHFAMFAGQWNQTIFRFGSPLVLSNPAIWNTSHVISHHVYTLTKDDLQDNYPLKRVQPIMPHLFFHRYQHYYIWIVYAIGLPIWTFVDFLGCFPTLFTGKHEMRYFEIAQRVENLFVYSLNLFFTVALPFFIHDFYKALALSFVSNFVASMVVVVQISVNHEVKDTMNKLPDHKIDFGVHQTLTSHNYAVPSKLFLHLSGGLNLQVEHHLFPSLHYAHYYDIAPIVKQACKDWNLPYNESASIWEAVSKHYELLKFNSTPN